MGLTESLGSHESSIVGFRLESATLTIELEGVHRGNEVASATIRLFGVKSIERDGIAIRALPQELDDGEVLTLEHTEETLELLAEWTDFKTHLSETHSYRVICDSLTIKI
jgi:hypothetical protein